VQLDAQLSGCALAQGLGAGGTVRMVRQSEQYRFGSFS
jgi:hypothetical protein